MGESGLHEIGQELRRLRLAAGLSGVELATRAGVPQPTVSRVETGRRVSDAEVVVRLFGALGLEPADTDRLASRVREAYAASVPRRVDAGVSFRPGSAVELEQSAGLVRDFQSVVIPGPLRTAGYIAAIQSVSAGDEADRSAVLDDPERRFTFVITEGALRTWPGSGACMADQLAHLVAVSRRSNVELGVVPASASQASARLAVPLHGFTVYDEAAVTVETFTRELTFTDADEVRAYLEIFEGFRRSAVFGDEARSLVERVAGDYERVLGSIH
jgi:transcriptional regulator with XRE-family HTH domain